MNITILDRVAGTGFTYTTHVAMDDFMCIEAVFGGCYRTVGVKAGGLFSFVRLSTFTTH